MSRLAGGEAFFRIMAWCLLAIAITGFGANALARPQSLPPFSLRLAAHMLIMLSWYALLVVQAHLVAGRRIALHRALGQASLALAAALLAVGWMTGLAGFRRTHDGMVLLSDIVDLANFTILYALALLRRGQPADHKRLILFAAIAMTPPAIARIGAVLGLPIVSAAPMFLVLVLAPVACDLAKTRRVSGLTLGAAMLLIVSAGATVVMGASPAWLQMAERLAA